MVESRDERGVVFLNAEALLEDKQVDKIFRGSTLVSAAGNRVAFQRDANPCSESMQHRAPGGGRAGRMKTWWPVALLTLLVCCFPLSLYGASGAVTPELSVGPTSMSFGYVTVGTKVIEGITLKSTGTAAVDIEYAAVAVPGFTLLSTSFPIVLQPGQQTMLRVQFDPVVVGVAKGQVTISSTSSTNPRTAVDIWGKGRPKAVSVSSLVCSSASETGAATDACQVTLSAGAPSGGVAVSLSSNNAAVTVPTTVTVPAKATSASFTANVSSVSSTQTAVVTASAGGVATSFGIQLNAAAPVSVTLTPTSVSLLASQKQAFTAAVANTANTAVTWSLSAAVGSVSSTGVYTAPTTITTAQTVNVVAVSVANPSVSAYAIVQLKPSVATLSVSTPSVSFGNVVLNTTSTQAVTLTSTGNTSVTVTGAAITGAGFSRSGVTLPITLSPLQAVTLNVMFDPTVTGSASGSLTITSNSSTSGTAVIPLSGTGVAASYTVDLGWKAPASSPDPVAGYNVYRAPSGSTAYVLLNSVGNTTTTYVDSTVLGGQTYDYIVDSVDASGVESVPSNMIAVAVP